jgi:cobalt/nickel transport system permease protein
MHIYEGVLAATPHGREILLAGTALAAMGTAIGLKKLDPEHLPRTAVFSAAFFVISSIHVPLWPTSVHLLLTGLMGVMLGWIAFPVILVALTLQAVLFSYGGLTVLGLNTFIMAFPAVVCYYLFHRAISSERETLAFCGGFAAGAFAIFLSALLVACSLALAGKEFESLGRIFFVSHAPLILTEGLVSASVTALIRKVRPELFDAPILTPIPIKAENG